MSLNSFEAQKEIELLLYVKRKEENEEENEQNEKKMKQQVTGINSNCIVENQLIHYTEYTEQLPGGLQQEFDDNFPFINCSIFGSQDKIATSENIIIIEPYGLEWVRKVFPKIMSLINLHDFKTFFCSITPLSINQAYPKYFFILCKLWIRPLYINEMLDTKYLNRDKNWDKMCDFHQPLIYEKYSIFSIENLKKVNGLNKCTQGHSLRSKLGEFHTLCKKYQIIGQIVRFMTFKEFRSIIDLINKQCQEEKITDSDLLTHTKALQEYAFIVEQLKQNTVGQPKVQPNMKKTIDILIQDIQELFQIPEIDVYKYPILQQIADIIKMDKFDQKDKKKWTDFQQLVLTIFKQDSNLQNSEYSPKKETKKCKYYKQQVKQDQRFSQNHLANPQQNEEFVDACLGIDSVHQKISLEN